jgi:hypothetical protein
LAEGVEDNGRKKKSGQQDDDQWLDAGVFPFPKKTGLR